MSFLTAFSFCSAPAQEFKDLFNGKDLTGWDANPKLWTVENGTIVGKTTSPKDLDHNQFLIWKDGEVENFELRVKIRVTGNNNSGIQYRSTLRPKVGKWSIAGYQCDVHPKDIHNAMIYEEGGRGILVKNGQHVVTDQKGEQWITAEHDPIGADISKWNEYTVIAKGNHIVHKVNGKTTIEFTDHDESALKLKGLLAFQIHRGPAMKVEIKEILYRPLPHGGITPYENSDIPSDAQNLQNSSQNKKSQATKKKPRNATEPSEAKTLATSVEKIVAKENFNVELIYSVPANEQGSWVALCPDDKGRIYACDQHGGLFLFTPPEIGKTLQKNDITRVPVNIRAINGMVFHQGAIYAGVNDYERKFTSGFYKISDSDADGELDKVELLRAFKSNSDHGVHAVVPAKDGESFYLITGNNATIEGGPISGTSETSQVPKIWGDDHLLPRLPDGRGHNRHVQAPGGIIYKISKDGTKFEIFASGFRNIYGGDINKQGELFTFDADMEYDLNTSWYRPTRVNHVVSGGEYGWRNGAGKYPEFYPDNLPSTINIGPGSPTGTRFGYGAKFPAKYQNAYYILDWSWGKIYAVHLTPEGASYSATKEPFISGTPLPVTDVIIHPEDGAMYYATGGRRIQSGLYRVTYTGAEDTSPAQSSEKIHRLAALRHEIEAFHGHPDPAALEKLWPHLDHPDTHIRWAARTALEHQPVNTWADKAINETSPAIRVQALLALARVKGVAPSHRPSKGHKIDTDIRDSILNSLLSLEYESLNLTEKITFLRTIQITLIRLGDPAQTTIDSLITTLDKAYPAQTFSENWLLTETLVHLQAPTAAAKGIVLLHSADGQAPQLEYARSLRKLKTGWTPELREQQLKWFLKAASYRGGASFTKFVEMIKNDTLATFSDEEKVTHATLIAAQPKKKSQIENLGAIFTGRTPKAWTLEDLSTPARTKMINRDYETGRKMFTAAACIACHKFGDSGGMAGPELTGSGGRYNAHDFLDQVINPSKVISDQFSQIIVTKKDGTTVTGVIVNLRNGSVDLNINPADPNDRIVVKDEDVKSIEESKISSMPPMLLSMMNEDEILDLTAYVLSGGDNENPMFKKAHPTPAE